MATLRTIVFVAAAAGLAAATMSFAAETITYQYDARGRLISVVHNGSVNDNLVTNYTFDDANNRKNLTVSGSPTPP